MKNEWKGKELNTSFIMIFSEENIPDMHHRIGENIHSITKDEKKERFRCKSFLGILVLILSKNNSYSIG